MFVCVFVFVYTQNSFPHAKFCSGMSFIACLFTSLFTGMMLKENNTLKKLYLKNCGLQPEGLVQVFKSVQVNTKLEILILVHNTIDDMSASHLGKCICTMIFHAHHLTLDMHILTTCLLLTPYTHAHHDTCSYWHKCYDINACVHNCPTQVPEALVQPAMTTPTYAGQAIHMF